MKCVFSFFYQNLKFLEHVLHSLNTCNVIEYPLQSEYFLFCDKRYLEGKTLSPNLLFKFSISSTKHVNFARQRCLFVLHFIVVTFSKFHFFSSRRCSPVTETQHQTFPSLYSFGCFDENEIVEVVYFPCSAWEFADVTSDCPVQVA